MLSRYLECLGICRCLWFGNKASYVCVCHSIFIVSAQNMSGMPYIALVYYNYGNNYTQWSHNRHG